MEHDSKREKKNLFDQGSDLSEPLLDDATSEVSDDDVGHESYQAPISSLSSSQGAQSIGLPPITSNPVARRRERGSIDGVFTGSLHNNENEAAVAAHAAVPTRRFPSWGGTFLVAALFVLLAFALLNLSFLGVQGEFLSLLVGSEFLTGVAVTLASVSLVWLLNLAMYWIKANKVVATPPAKAIASAENMLEILQRWPWPNASEAAKKRFKQVLEANIDNAIEWLAAKNGWRNGLVKYGDTWTFSNLSPFSDIESDLKTLLEFSGDFEGIFSPLSKFSESQKQQRIEQLKEVFARFATEVEIDPDYRIPLPQKSAFSLSLIATLLFTGCVATLGFIFTNFVPYGMAWSMPLAAILGVASWLAARYVLNNTSGGPYAQFATIFALGAITFIVLGIFFQAGYDVGLSGLVLGAVTPVWVVLFLSFAGFALWYGSKDRTRRTAHQKSHFFRVARGALLLIKVLLLVGFLFLAFLSIAMAFNLQGIGALSNLGDFAAGVIWRILGFQLAEIGFNWQRAFFMAIFSAAGSIAFELFKDIVTVAPSQGASVSKRKAHQGVKSALTIFGRFVFFLGMIMALYAIQSTGAFMEQPTTHLFPFFLILGIFSTLFSTNADIPFAQDFSKWFNNHFGLKPSINKAKPWLYLLFKEIKVFLALTIFLSISVGFLALGGHSLSFMGFWSLFTGILATIVFRVCVMAWHRFNDPEAWAVSYLEASAVSPPLLEQRDLLHDIQRLKNEQQTAQMFVEFYPAEGGNFGHVSVRFVLENGDPDIYFSWGNFTANYTRLAHQSFPLPEAKLRCILLASSRISPAGLEQVDQYIRANLMVKTDPPTFGGRAYNTLSNNCSHVALQVMQEALLKGVLPRFSQGNVVRAKVREEIDKINDLLIGKGPYFLWPGAAVRPQPMILGLTDILLELNNFEQNPNYIDGPLTKVEILNYQLAYVELQIAKAQIQQSAGFVIPEVTNRVNVLHELREKKRKLEEALGRSKPETKRGVALTPRMLKMEGNKGKKVLAMLGESSEPIVNQPSVSDSAIVETKQEAPQVQGTLGILNYLASDVDAGSVSLDSPVADSPVATSIRSKSFASMTRGMSNLTIENPLPEKKTSRIKVLSQKIWWVSLIFSWVILTLLLTPIGQAFLIGNSAIPVFIAGFVTAALSIFGLARRVQEEWHFSRLKEKAEFVAMGLGVVLFAVLLILVTTLSAAALSSMTFVLPFLLATTLLTSYFFARQRLFTNFIEKAWRILAQVETGAILQKLQEGEEISIGEKKQLGYFINIAIQAMEHELARYERNLDHIIQWVDGPVGASYLFKQDLQLLKEFRVTLQADEGYGKNSVAQFFPVFAATEHHETKRTRRGLVNDHSIPSVCERLKNCKMTPVNNSSAKKRVLVLFVALFVGLIGILPFLTLGLDSALLTFNIFQMVSWIGGGLALMFLLTNAKNRTTKVVGIFIAMLGVLITATTFFFLQFGTISALAAPQIVGWLLGGLTVTVLALKMMMEWMRQRPDSFDACIHPKLEWTAERAMVWTINTILVAAILIVGILLGTASTLFLPVVLVGVTWGLGQLVNMSIREWLEKSHSAAPYAEMVSPISPLASPEPPSAISPAPVAMQQREAAAPPSLRFFTEAPPSVASLAAASAAADDVDHGNGAIMVAAENSGQ